ncbi:MAG: alpha/beta hydrolase [Flammeovirgaceae bacterium]|nr:alpha/beta hydrolase [Flammeovirgaceae bacterium]
MALVHFVEKGSGPPIIFLHGFCESLEVWNDFASQLAQNYRIIMPDLPGFGKSVPLHGPFELHDVGLALLTWLDALGITSCLLIGHSLGGYVTLDMANHQPERFAGIGLIHSTAYADTLEKKSGRDLVNDFVKRNGTEPFIKSFVPGLFANPGHEAAVVVKKIANQTNPQSIIDYNLAMKNRRPQLDFLTYNQNPVLIVGGENDSIIPIATLHEQSRLNSRIQFHSLKDTGHMGMFESPLIMSQIIQNFADLCNFR